MNALQYFDELNETEETARPIITHLPKTEAERVRAWFDGLDFGKIEPSKYISAEFYKYQIKVARSQIAGYYFYVTSPQQKSWGRPGYWYAKGATPEDLRAGVERFIKEREAAASKRAEKTNAKRQARASFVNPYKVGQFLYTCWGYDQTNREFFQILEVRETSLRIREVGQNRTDHDRNGDSWLTAPVAGEFIAPESWVTIHVYPNGYHTIKDPHYSHGLSLWDGRPIYASDGH